MKRIVMETAIFWLVILGPVIIGVACAVYYGGSKGIAVWTGFLGCVLLLLAAALQWQQVIDKEEAVSEKVDRPWIGVHHIDPEPLRVGSSLRATVYFVNSGNVAAINVRGHVQAATVPRGGTPPPPLEKFSLPVNPSAVMIPSVMMRLIAFNDDQFNLKLPGDIDVIKNGILVPWITARVEYEDRAGTPYHTMFRGFFDSSIGTYVVAEPGNEAK